nr:transposon Ty3-I Gag-Pol polyprotein [Tanacetum cinerariifolium]
SYERIGYKYKAEKVCHKEMVKMPLVDLKVLEDGSFRICMDYRKLSEIDIRNRCHQVRVHEYEIPKTAFRMRYGRCDVRTLIMEETHATKYSVRPRTAGPSERTFRTLENMFRACVRNLVVVGILTFCEVSFPTKIVIIRVFHVFSLEVLYGRIGRSPVLKAEIEESKMIGLELEKETTKVVMIKERLKEAKGHQES